MPLQFDKVSKLPNFGNLISFVLETRLQERRGNQILLKWGFTGTTEVPREGLSGGLALGWTHAWDVLIQLQNRHFIH